MSEGNSRDGYATSFEPYLAVTEEVVFADVCPQFHGIEVELAFNKEQQSSILSPSIHDGLETSTIININLNLQPSSSGLTDSWENIHSHDITTSTPKSSSSAPFFTASALRSFSPLEDSTMSSLQDSGIGLASSSFCSSDVQRTIPSVASCNSSGYFQSSLLGGRGFSISDNEQLSMARQEQRARLCRELDLCHLREMKKEQRTPSPSVQRGLDSRVDAENFNVHCYYRSERPSSSSVSLTPRSASGGRGGLRSIDCNVQQDSGLLHYDSRCASLQAPRYAVVAESSAGEKLKWYKSPGNFQDNGYSTSTPNQPECTVLCILCEDHSKLSANKSHLSCNAELNRTTPQAAFRFNAQTTAQSAPEAEGVHRKKRPPHSYMSLIQMALCSVPDCRMTLREIYDWIETTFPYYKHISNQGWKNSIRHNLSLYDIFVRKKPSPPSKSSSSYWTMVSQDQAANLRAQTQTQNSRSQNSQSSGSSSLPEYSDSLHDQRPSTKKGPVPLLPKPSSNAFAVVQLQDRSQSDVAQSFIKSNSSFSSGVGHPSLQPRDGYLQARFSDSYSATQTTALQNKRQPIINKRRSAAALTITVGPKAAKRSNTPDLLVKTKTRTPKQRSSCDSWIDDDESSTLDNSGELSLSELVGFSDVVSPFPINLSIDDSTSLGNSFSSTSELRHQLSHLSFKRACGGDSHVATNQNPIDNNGGSSNEDIQKGLPKPKIYQRNRRKQEFKILCDESDIVEEVTTVKRHVSSEYASDTFAAKSSSSTRGGDESYDIREIFSCTKISGTPGANEGIDEGAMLSLLPADSDLLRTPSSHDADLEDDSLMLFTPFRGGDAISDAAGMLSSPSPIKYLSCLMSGRKWNTVLETPDRDSKTRTSTPFTMMSSTVEHSPNDLNAALSTRTLYTFSPINVDLARYTPDCRTSRADAPGSCFSVVNTPGLSRILFSEQSPPDIGFVMHSPSFKRLLGEMPTCDDNLSVTDVSHILSFSPFH